MSALLLRAPPYALLGALCGGVAAANLARVSWLVLAAAGAVAGVAASAATDATRLVAATMALALLGWWWGSARLARIDESTLLGQVDRAERAVVVVTAPPRWGRYELRVPVQVRRFGRLRLAEPAQLELPLRRAPPQGGVLALLATVTLPRGPSHGFDERTWLRRHGVHVVLRADSWRLIGRRGGLAGLADRLRSRLARSVAPGLHGERRGVVEGVVLGDEQGLSTGLRERFRASGLYHLLAVSGQNVALVAGGVLEVVWLVALPRWVGQLGALAGIGAYVLAVGLQPSVVRAGIAGALGSLAWLAARGADRWYLLLVAALALLAWNPYVALDAGFELSFAAVAAIFTLAPRLADRLDGYPLPEKVATVISISAACALATAPILWLQFGTVPLLTVPANVLAAPAVPPLLGFALAAAAVTPIAPGAGALLAQASGLCAAYLAACANVVGGLPFAQVRSGAAVTATAAAAVLAGTYAWRGGGTRTGIPAHRQ